MGGRAMPSRMRRRRVRTLFSNPYDDISLYMYHVVRVQTVTGPMDQENGQNVPTVCPLSMLWPTLSTQLLSDVASHNLSSWTQTGYNIVTA